VNKEERQPWDRQLGEGSKAYSHFCIYRDMGSGRSLQKMTSVPGCTSVRRQLSRWSSRWRWVERAQAYDDYLQHQDRLRQEKERKDMLSRHAKIAVLGQNLVVKGIEKLVADVEQGKRDLTASDASRLLDVVVKIERLSRGEPTEISELGGSDEHPVRVNIEDRARQAVERALGIADHAADRGASERNEAEESADVPPLPSPPDE
jgi:hypothetical protein